MKGRGALTGAWAWAATVTIGVVVLDVALGASGLLTPESVALSLLGPAYAGLGLVIVVRQPGNRLAWLLFVVATWVLISGATVLRFRNQPAAPSPAEIWDVLSLIWDNSGYFIGMIVPLFLFLYIFPTGRFLTRRWAWTGSVSALLTSCSVFVEAFKPEIGPTDDDWTITNPIGFLQSGVEVLQALTGVGLVVLMIGGFMAIIVRYRRADAQIRAQIKWVVFALLLMAGIFVMSIFVNPVLPDWLDSTLFVLVLMAPPISVTLAITRYRLFEIDRIISRTFGYLVVVGILGFLYVAVAVWLPTQVIGEQPPLFVAVATLTGAALFTPLRRLVLERLDRRFNRARYDGERVLEGFVANLRDVTDIEQLRRDSSAVVRRTMQPEAVGIWIRSSAMDFNG